MRGMNGNSLLLGGLRRLLLRRRRGHARLKPSARLRLSGGLRRWSALRLGAPLVPAATAVLIICSHWSGGREHCHSQYRSERLADVEFHGHLRIESIF